MLRAVRAVGGVCPRVTPTESVARRLTRVVGVDGDAPGATANQPPIKRMSNPYRRVPTVASSRMNRGWTAERAPPPFTSRAPTLLARASADWDGETLGVLRRRANALETRVKTRSTSWTSIASPRPPTWTRPPPKAPLGRPDQG